MGHPLPEWSAGGATAKAKVFVDGNIGCGGKLIPGKTYRITINKWTGAYDEGGWGFPAVDGIMAHDKSIVIREYSGTGPIPPHDEATESVWTIGIKNPQPDSTLGSLDGRIMISSPSLTSPVYIPSSTGWCSDDSSCVKNIVLQKDEKVTLTITPKDNNNKICLAFVGKNQVTGEIELNLYCHVDSTGKDLTGTWTMVFPDELVNAGWPEEDAEIKTGEFYATIYS